MAVPVGPKDVLPRYKSLPALRVQGQRVGLECPSAERLRGGDRSAARRHERDLRCDCRHAPARLSVDGLPVHGLRIGGLPIGGLPERGLPLYWLAVGRLPRRAAPY